MIWHLYDRRYLFAVPIDARVVLTSPVVSLEKELTKRKANGIEFKWSYNNQNSTYMGKFQLNFDQGK